jgi:transposase InsO family protein
VQCRPIRKATAKAVSQALYEEVVSRFGCPRTVISDNGTQFTGQTFKNFLNGLGIVHRLTPPYTPQANPVERTNKTLKTMVAQFCEADHRKWDVHLSDLVFAINSSRHDSTGFSPAFLNFGREMDPPKPLYRDPVSREIVQDSPTGEETADFTDQTARLQKLKDIYELVRINLGRAFSTQSRQYNLRRREWRCHVGDKVMKKENPLSSAVKGFAAKLAPKYSGPYTVSKVLSPVVYDLKTSTGATLRKIHIKDLKPAL